MATLNPDVETMSLSTLQPSPAPITDAPTTQRTFERDCTMPGLCPETWQPVTVEPEDRRCLR